MAGSMHLGGLAPILLCCSSEDVWCFFQARRRRREASSKALQATFDRIQLYAHGARLSAWDEATRQALQRHLVRGLGAEAVDQLLLYQQVNLQGCPPALRCCSSI